MTEKRQIGTILVRREDDGQEFELMVISTFRQNITTWGATEVEDKLKDVASPDGREVYTTDEVHFFFADEPDRPMVVVSRTEA